MWDTDRHRFRDQRTDGGRRIGPGGDRRPRSPLKLFLLVFAFSVPFWLIGAVIDMQCLPGVPFSSLSAFCPLLAALALVFVESRTAGVVALLKRSFDFKRIRRKSWYLPVVLLMPGVSVLVYGRCAG